MRFADALAELDARQPEHMPKPDLERIRALADLLDSPQLTYPTIHVTGTNGKTTTARLAERIACAHGLTTGLFTSPHLRSVTERFQLCGRPIAEGEFGQEYEHLLPYLRTVDERVGRVTYFEALAALAFLWFADKPVALGVFEVGMGGTWDATNLVAGDVAVICPVGLDHPELGSSVAEVATEKAGIVKEGRIAVVREQEAEALEVIEARSADVGARLLLEGRDWELETRSPAFGGQALGSAGCTRRTRTCCSRSSASSPPTARRPRSSRPRPCSSAPSRRRPFARPWRAPRRPAGSRSSAAVRSSSSTARTTPRRPRRSSPRSPRRSRGTGCTWSSPCSRTRTWTASPTRSPRSPTPATRRRPTASAARPTQEIERALSSRGVATQAFPGVHAALDAARAAAAPEDLILVTGSLYTVAAAREALVKEIPIVTVESTLLIVKPDGVRRGLVGEVLARVEAKGLRIAEMRMMQIDRPLAEEHYAEHREKPFFGELVGFITSGPVVVARLEAEGAIDVLADADGAHGPGHGPAGHDPRRPRADHHREHRARQRLARVRGARAQALLRLSAAWTRPRRSSGSASTSSPGVATWRPRGSRSP